VTRRTYSESGPTGMNISDNLLKHYLRHVYFIGGTACGGKTTLAKRLAEKHAFLLYGEGPHHEEHRRLASPEFQPAMTREFSGWEEYFGRPYPEYAQWLLETTREDAEMALLDLVVQSSANSDRKVVADLHLPLEMAARITDHGRVVFLVAEPRLVVADYFGRPDHQEILDCIARLPNSAHLKANVERTLAHGTERFLQELERTQWYSITRDEHSCVDHTLRLIEQHLGLA
jgi:hypothetical protein